MMFETNNSLIGYSDIPPITGFSTARMTRESIEDINGIEDMAWLDLDEDEIAALKKYREANVDFM